jgi:hypothetical protein
LDGLAFAFAALGKPGGEAFGEAFRSEAVTGFDAAIGDGESVVEFSGVCEIAHAELVEPIERAGLSFAANEEFDRELLRVHASILALGCVKLAGGKGIS